MSGERPRFGLSKLRLLYTTLMLHWRAGRCEAWEGVVAGELVAMVSLGRHRQASLFGSFYDANVFCNLGHETALCIRVRAMCTFWLQRKKLLHYKALPILFLIYTLFPENLPPTAR